MTGVLVSGASVAGPALAYWLGRYGFEPTVVERAPAAREGGQAIDLRGAAREAVGRMGLIEEVRRAHTGARGWRSSMVRAGGWPAWEPGCSAIRGAR
jgi:2-polyprenyl-6-methoxyphenol hydroxylase-like FAD-dependent oxidoreductase